MSLVGQDQREVDYRECRGAVLAVLKRSYPGVPDHEEIYQEAWAEALERERRGGDLTDPEGLLVTIATRRARDWLRKRRDEQIPGPDFFARQPDLGVPSDEVVGVKVDANRIWQ